MNTTSIPMIPLTPIPLPPRGSWPEAVHLFDEESAWAVRSALAAQRRITVPFIREVLGEP